MKRASDTKRWARDPSASRIGGFSLIELVIVVATVSIITGVVSASMKGLLGARQNVAASRVRTALVYAQEWAVGAALDTWVSFDKNTNQVSAFVEDPDKPGKANRVPITDPLTRSDLTVVLDDSEAGLKDVDFQGSDEVRFDERGTPCSAGDIALTADGLVTITGGVVIRVSKNTGLITID